MEQLSADLIFQQTKPIPPTRRIVAFLLVRASHGPDGFLSIGQLGIMRRSLLALLLLLAATATPLVAETISQNEPMLFDPYREPARPLLSQSPHWTARTQQSGNMAFLLQDHADQVFKSPAQLAPLNQAPLSQRHTFSVPTPMHNGANDSRSQWTGIRQSQRRLNTVENKTRFYASGNQPAPNRRLKGNVRGLIMTKDNSPLWSLAQSSGGQSLTTLDADMDSAGGFEVSLQKPLPDQTRAELVYWGLFTAGDSATLEDPSFAIQSTLDISGLNYGSTGDPLENQLSVGQASLARDFQYHNLELNWGGTATGEQLTLEYLVGFRYFKASEDLALQMDDFELVGRDDNHLFGVQVGALLNWQPQKQLEIHTGVRFGIFANSIDHHLHIQGPDGFAYAGTPELAQELNYTLQSSTAATLGQFDFGVTHHSSERIRLTMGYRIVAVTGLSLISNQLPQDLAELAVSPRVQPHATMMLHGAYAGVEADF